MDSANCLEGFIGDPNELKIDLVYNRSPSQCFESLDTANSLKVMLHCPRDKTFVLRGEKDQRHVYCLF